MMYMYNVYNLACKILYDSAHYCMCTYMYMYFDIFDSKYDMTRIDCMTFRDFVVMLVIDVRTNKYHFEMTC